MKAVIITGSAGGLGASLVGAFSAAGYFTVGVDLQPTPAAHASVLTDLEAVGADHAAGERLGQQLAQLVERRGLKALVNNAAVQILANFSELDLAAFHKTLNVNVLAGFRLAQLLAPRLEESRGAIVNIGSIHSRLTKRQFVAYATSKAALEGMGRALAVELGDRVRVNTIRPAAIATEMLREGFAGAPEKLEELAAHHPSGRLGLPEEVARLAVWLAGDEARFINGAAIDIDGAIGARLHDPS